MKSKRIYIYFSKIIKGKLPKKMKMKTNSNSLHKPEYRTYNLIVQFEESFLKVTKIIGDDEFDINSLKQYYTGKHIQIWEYPISKKDEIMRVYLK